MDYFYEEFFNLPSYWKDLVKIHENKKFSVDSFHFCLSYQDLISFAGILKKYDKFPAVITKNINYLLIDIKSEIAEKHKDEVLEKNYFIINSLRNEVLIQNILQSFNKNEEDHLKSFITYLLLNGDDSELFEEFSNENDLFRQKPKLVIIFFLFFFIFFKKMIFSRFSK